VFKVKRLKVRKPHDRIVDDMLKNGYSRVRNYPIGMYMLQIQKHTKAIKVKPIRDNDFLVLPRADIRKDRRRSSGKKYSYYDILKF